MEPLRRVFRGYDSAQVDQLLSELNSKTDAQTRVIEALQAENERLRNQVDALAVQETAVKEALVSAHRQSDEVLAESRKEAEILLQVARDAGARMQEDLRGRISDLSWQIERLALQKQKFFNEFRAMLEGYLETISAPEQDRLPFHGDTIEPQLKAVIQDSTEDQAKVDSASEEPSPSQVVAES